MVQKARQSSIIAFLKREPVLIAAFSAAAVSVFFVQPDKGYLSYIDFRVIGLLFALMAVVAGLGQLGVFNRAAVWVAFKADNLRSLVLLLVALCYFSAMLITNDVALMTFVPFTLVVLEVCGQQEAAIYTIVLETVAANLGSALTPVGNPQNLFLYSYFQYTPAHFFRLTTPLVVMGGILLLILLLPIKKTTIIHEKQAVLPLEKKTHLILYTVLFVLCVLTVFNVIHYLVLISVLCLCLLFMDRGIFAKVDYSLLLTFICFFVFVGNLSRVPQVKTMLESLLAGRERILSALVSQVISNVPAAVMLSGFTENGDGLVVGTNLGGLGTLVASLASLISFRIYAKSKQAKRGRYLGIFTAVNVGLLLILGVFAEWWY